MNTAPSPQGCHEYMVCLIKWNGNPLCHIYQRFITAAGPDLDIQHDIKQRKLLLTDFMPYHGSLFRRDRTNCLYRLQIAAAVTILYLKEKCPVKTQALTCCNTYKHGVQHIIEI